MTANTRSSISIADLGELPSVGARGLGLLIELLLYGLVTMAIAIAEYYLGNFGPSNWWLGLAVVVALNLWSWRRSENVYSGPLSVALVSSQTGEPASYGSMAIRQLVRGLVIVGLPFLPFVDWRVTAVVLAVAVGFAIARTPGRRAPWDLIAGTTPIVGFTSQTTASGVLHSAADLQLDPARNRQNKRAQRLLLLASLMTVLLSALILWTVASEAWLFVSDQEFSWGSLRDVGWYPRRGRFDLSTLFVGTLWVTAIAILVAAPVGLGVAVYLSEYAKPRMQRIIKPVIETLASVPSVVLGLFAISFLGRTLLPNIFSEIGIFSIVAAGIGVGILTVPIVASIAEDALRAVPTELREAAYGLGSRRSTVALRVVFPAALSGIAAALIIGISRAIGETMVVAIAAGGSGGTLFDLNPVDPGQTITAAMASLGAGTDSVAGAGIAFQSLYFLGLLLFIITFALNLVSDRVVQRFREVY